MKVIVCGGRDFGTPVPDGSLESAAHAAEQRKSIYKILDMIVGPHSYTLIEGGAAGVDTVAGQWAEDDIKFHEKWDSLRHVDTQKHITVKAYWNKYGKAAGAIRNKEMLNLEPDLVIAFPGGKGTENMIYQAKQVGVPVLRVEV